MQNKILIKAHNYTEISRTVEFGSYNYKVILRLDRRIQELFSHTGNKVNPLLDPAIKSQDD